MPQSTCIVLVQAEAEAYPAKMGQAILTARSCNCRRFHTLLPAIQQHSKAHSKAIQQHNRLRAVSLMYQEA